MVILVCIIVFIWCTLGIAEENDREARRYNDNLRAERRHRELIEATRRKSYGAKKTTHRRIVKQGDVTLGEEIIEEHEDE